MRARKHIFQSKNFSSCCTTTCRAGFRRVARGPYKNNNYKNSWRKKPLRSCSALHSGIVLREGTTVSRGGGARIYKSARVVMNETKWFSKNQLDSNICNAFAMLANRLNFRPTAISSREDDDDDDETPCCALHSVLLGLCVKECRIGCYCAEEK